MNNPPQQTSDTTHNAIRRRVIADQRTKNRELDACLSKLELDLTTAFLLAKERQKTECDKRFAMAISVVERFREQCTPVKGLTKKSHIAELGLSASIVDSLEKWGIETIGDIETHGKDGLLQVYGISYDGLDKIRDALNRAGFNFWGFSK